MPLLFFTLKNRIWKYLLLQFGTDDFKNRGLVASRPTVGMPLHAQLETDMSLFGWQCKVYHRCYRNRWTDRQRQKDRETCLNSIQYKPYDASETSFGVCCKGWDKMFTSPDGWVYTFPLDLCIN